jgi:hypothetical protein
MRIRGGCHGKRAYQASHGRRLVLTDLGTTLVFGREGPMTRAPCATCGASDWGTRNRCNPCRASAARVAWASSANEARAKDRERLRTWRAANPEKTRAQRRSQRYMLDAAAFEALLSAQEGRCAVCRAPGAACVDHCHTTGRVRGILCRACNTGLGQFRDDRILILAAATYLEESSK